MPRWTPESRARQAALIHDWQPWTKSTGAKSDEGKAKVAANSPGRYFRERLRFVCWLARMTAHMRQGRDVGDIEPEMRRRARKIGIFDN